MDNPFFVRRSFFRDLTRERPGLFKAILNFNARIHCPESKQQTLVKGSNRVKARLIGPYTKGFWDFEEESRRLALLDRSTFERLIFSWGAAFCAPLLNRVVLKTELEMLEKGVDPVYLDFARGRGRFFFGDLTSVIPLNQADTKDLPRLVPQYGIEACRILSSAWPEPLQRLHQNSLARILAHSPQAESGKQTASPADLRAVWFSVKKILLKEVAPEWTPCFS